MALRQAESELDIIYNFYLEIKDDPYCGGYYTKEILHGKEVHTIPNGNSIESIDVMNYYLIDFYGKNGFPCVLPDKEFDKIKSPIVFRGVSDIKHTQTLLNSIIYHYGKGYFGNGIYFSTSKERALWYTGKKNPIETNIATFKIDSQVKMISNSWINYMIDYVDCATREECKQFNYNHLRPAMTPEIKQKVDDLIKFINKKNDPVFREFFITERDSILAPYLGFDVVVNFLAENYDLKYSDEYNHCVGKDCSGLNFDIIKDYLNNNHHGINYLDLVLYNRGALIVSEKEYNRIINSDESFK